MLNFGPINNPESPTTPGINDVSSPTIPSHSSSPSSHNALPALASPLILLSDGGGDVDGCGEPEVREILGLGYVLDGALEEEEEADAGAGLSSVWW